eukprot:scaffold4091_cov191-Pinguiococcus_pyrenoidosus.AAC.1
MVGSPWTSDPFHDGEDYTVENVSTPADTVQSPGPCECFISLQLQDSRIITALCDTGSSMTLLRDGGRLPTAPARIRVTGATGNCRQISRQAMISACLPDRPAVQLQHPALLNPDLPIECILGVDFMRKHRMHVNVVDQYVTIFDGAIRVPFLTDRLVDRACVVRDGMFMHAQLFSATADPAFAEVDALRRADPFADGGKNPHPDKRIKLCPSFP